MTATIDLAAYNSSGVRVFAGRDRGEAARKKAKLDQLDQGDERVLVKIPEDIVSINSSFFLGMFGASIRKLGEAGFRAQYQFDGQDVDLVLEDVIRVALRTSSPLGETGEHEAKARDSK